MSEEELPVYKMIINEEGATPANVHLLFVWLRTLEVLID